MTDLIDPIGGGLVRVVEGAGVEEPKRSRRPRRAKGETKKQDPSASDNWCSPEWFTKLLGPVDLDPCSNAASTVQATFKFESGGIEDPWPRELGGWANGVVNSIRVYDPVRSAFWNPEYSRPLPWCERAIEFTAHGGESIGLLKLDPTTAWFRTLARASASFFPLRKRMTFAPGPGLTTGTTANFPSVVVHLGQRRHFAGFLFDLVDQGHAWPAFQPGR